MFWNFIVKKFSYFVPFFIISIGNIFNFFCLFSWVVKIISSSLYEICQLSHVLKMLYLGICLFVGVLFEESFLSKIFSHIVSNSTQLQGILFYVVYCMLYSVLVFNEWNISSFFYQLQNNFQLQNSWTNLSQNQFSSTPITNPHEGDFEPYLYGQMYFVDWIWILL